MDQIQAILNYLDNVIDKDDKPITDLTDWDKGRMFGLLEARSIIINLLHGVSNE